MSFRKFGPNDIVLNTMRAFPQVRFNIYNTKVYYNNTPHQSGAFSDNILNITSSTGGGISLYEYNIDKAGTTSMHGQGPYDTETTGRNPPIVPFITKDSARASFKTANSRSFNNEFQYGDILQSNYPLTASITRELMGPAAGARNATVDIYNEDALVPGSGSAVFPHFFALKNRLDY